MLEECACPGMGSCQGLYTANSMSCITEAMGMSMPGCGTALAGSVRLTPITIGETPALLLGPLTVAPEFKNRGLGKLLLRTAIDASAAAGETAILLVGDAPYYGPFGFQRVAFGSIGMPGPVDPARVLIASLNGSEPPSGQVRGGR